MPEAQSALTQNLINVPKIVEGTPSLDVLKASSGSKITALPCVYNEAKGEWLPDPDDIVIRGNLAAVLPADGDHTYVRLQIFTESGGTVKLPYGTPIAAYDDLKSTGPRLEAWLFRLGISRLPAGWLSTANSK